MWASSLCLVSEPTFTSSSAYHRHTVCLLRQQGESGMWWKTISSISLFFQFVRILKRLVIYSLTYSYLTFHHRWVIYESDSRDLTGTFLRPISQVLKISGHKMNLKNTLVKLLLCLPVDKTLFCHLPSFVASTPACWVAAKSSGCVTGRRRLCWVRPPTTCTGTTSPRTVNRTSGKSTLQDYDMTWKCFPLSWPFMRGIHRYQWIEL